MKILILFTVLTILNTIIQTIKSIATIRCGKTLASLINALAYGLYTYVIIFTSAEGMSIHIKALITALANLVGVYVVKLVEEKTRKDKLWKVEATIPVELAEKVKHDLKANHLSYNYIDIGKYFLFNVYCETQEESNTAKIVLDYYNAKYFVGESKTL